MREILVMGGWRLCHLIWSLGLGCSRVEKKEWSEIAYERSFSGLVVTIGRDDAERARKEFPKAKILLLDRFRQITKDQPKIETEGWGWSIAWPNPGRPTDSEKRFLDKTVRKLLE